MKSALVSLTFDDGLRCQFDKAVPILERHGFPATFFLVANTDPIHEHPGWSKIDWNEKDILYLKGLIQRGNEIGAHSVHHRQPYLDENPKFEAEGSKQWIEERLGGAIPSYCYPFYHLTAPIKNAVINAGYEQARAGAGNSHISRNSCNFFEVDCRQITTRENVTEWVRPGCWHVLTFHGIGTDQDGWEPITVSELARQMIELAKLRDSGAVEVVTFKDAASRFRESPS